ncbi:hypothetical protein EXIGLDRAFT_703278 [Exidia glandulosa HHB12029]|uniref:ATP-dependent helicase CHD1-2/hrp3 HTH domain-containing protein n=1 Tax=Exidia glandulosa HHB12029 TaxID=1314781 RepID=A0A165C4J5_EXIGL|nr:hypothetical protein EXIGLDRAFT_703278 [Exidia glandulosa HHB12029]
MSGSSKGVPFGFLRSTAELALAVNAITQKSKAILVTFRNVQNINAETVISRVHELKILYEYLNHLTTEEIYQWQLPVDNIRPTLNWYCKSGPPEDPMLLVRAFLHGFGNWERIGKDDSLHLQDKEEEPDESESESGEREDREW